MVAADVSDTMKQNAVLVAFWSKTILINRNVRMTAMIFINGQNKDNLLACCVTDGTLRQSGVFGSHALSFLQLTNWAFQNCVYLTIVIQTIL